MKNLCINDILLFATIGLMSIVTAALVFNSENTITLPSPQNIPAFDGATDIVSITDPAGNIYEYNKRFCANPHFVKTTQNTAIGYTPIDPMPYTLICDSN